MLSLSSGCNTRPTKMNPIPSNKKGANQIWILRYPALIDGNDSFPLGEYQVSHEGMAEKGNYFLTIHHEIRGAYLIEDFIKEQKAVYACAVASPCTAYREIQISLYQLQKVTWDPANFGEPPYFTPMIICKEEIKYQLDKAKDGVHENWDCEQVVFPKGAFLAVHPVMRLREVGFKSLIYLHPDDRNEVKGQFRVDISAGSTFRFNVWCEQDFYNFVTSNRGTDRYHDILRNIATACFARLQREYRLEGKVEEHLNYKELDALSDQLKGKGYPNWTHSDFKPEEAATLLYPHERLIQRDDNE